MKKKSQMGFTLVEIMIVVAIIAILAAIAIPNFVRNRKKSQQSACIANMKQIFGAAEQYRLDATAETAELTAVSQLLADYIKATETPKCPLGTTDYTLDTDGTGNVTCPNAKGEYASGKKYPHVLP